MGVTARSTQGVRVEIAAGRHRLVADEAVGAGEDTGPNPYDLLLAALGACTVMTVELYARRKGWPLEEVRVALDHTKIYSRDCADCDSDPTARVDVIELVLSFSGELTAEQVARLMEIAGRCPVNRTLTGEIKIRKALAET
jgi:putative redox protein